MKHLTIGSRGSKLALAQTHLVRALLQREFPGLEVSVRKIRTTGDKLTATPLSQLAGENKGLFVKEIEEALLDRSIDLAVHSLKDLPTDLPNGLVLGAIPRREDPRDALVAGRLLDSLDQLPAGSRIGTSSLRRETQLRHLRPDLEIVPVRGNVDTRIRKIDSEGLAAVVLAVAGLRRMALDSHISFIFPADQMIPAVGQGALGLEVRRGDEEVEELVSRLDDRNTRVAVQGERAFLDMMGGGCQVPMGAHASLGGGRARLAAFVASPTGERMIRDTIEGPEQKLREMAIRLARSFRESGADKILAEVGLG
ncbi:MAG: hydroxymethylbilane synthase [Acidobacteriota bacterium]